MKTVCFLVISDGIGGAEHVVEKIVSRLDSQKFRAILVLNSEIAPYFRRQVPAAQILDVGRIYPASRIAASLIFHAQRLFDPLKLRLQAKLGQIEEFLAKHDCQTLSVHLMYDLYLAVQLKSRQPHLRLVYSIHGLLSLDPDAARYVHSHHQFAALLKQCDQLVCVSLHIQKVLLEVMPEAQAKSMVIENGIDRAYLASFRADRNPRRSERNGPLVLFCGGDKEVKGGAILQQALDSICSAPSTFKFRILGPISHDSVWYALAAKFPGAIEVLGFQAKEVLYQEIANADLVLMPSLSEGHPIIALEALSLGVPVFASDIPAFQHLLPENQRFALTVEGMLAVLHRIATDSTCMQIADSHAASFHAQDWMEVVSRYEALF